MRRLKTAPSEEEFSKFDSCFFTSADFAVCIYSFFFLFPQLFLEWLKQWSEVSQSNITLPSKINFTKEQTLHWQSAITYIKEQRYVYF